MMTWALAEALDHVAVARHHPDHPTENTAACSSETHTVEVAAVAAVGGRWSVVGGQRRRSVVSGRWSAAAVGGWKRVSERPFNRAVGRRFSNDVTLQEHVGMLPITTALIKFRSTFISSLQTQKQHVPI
jgi:hypothetical protein